MKLRALLIVCLLAWALPSLAGSVPNCYPYLPPGTSDALVVCAPNNTVYDFVSVLEANEDPNAIYTLAIAAPDPNQFGFATTFCEFDVPCGPGLLDYYYSDIFGVASVNGALYLGFSSDGENGTPYGGQGFYYVPASQGDWLRWYDATMYLDPALQAQGYTAYFTSVPEPTTLLLIGSGIGLLARRLRKK
jgi:PEP-CTERM motif